MRRHALWVLGMGALVAALIAGVSAAAGGEGMITVGEVLDVTAEVKASPKTLSRTSYTPIRLTLSQEVHGSDGHPPAERELLVELDKDVMVRTAGLPSCHLGGLQTGVTAEEACRAATVGAGQENFQVAFPESAAVEVPAKVQVFNGGERDGAITLYIYASFSAPIHGSVVTKVVLTRIHKGHFGWLAAATVPQVAGGGGSLVDLDLAIGRGVFSARCTDGKLRFHLQSRFVDGSESDEEIIHVCGR